MLFVGPMSLAVWSIGTWDHFLSSTKHFESPNTEIGAEPLWTTSAVNGRSRSGMAVGSAARPRRTRSHVVETPVPPPDLGNNPFWQAKMRVVVIATTPRNTVSALRAASGLAADLGAHVTLLAMEQVPLQFPLQEPPVSIDFLERKLHGLVCEANILGAEVLIQLCLCRSPRESLAAILPPHSLILIGRRKHWWEMRERNLSMTQKSAYFAVVTRLTKIRSLYDKRKVPWLQTNIRNTKH